MCLQYLPVAFLGLFSVINTITGSKDFSFLWQDMEIWPQSRQDWEPGPGAVPVTTQSYWNILNFSAELVLIYKFWNQNLNFRALKPKL